ncbi:endodeoxyribonuclease RusA [Gallibacterium genomosp. 3]|uniref:Crossover junction endodeoxyribonuclease rusA n=1 Tax=Gallibacterium genomosp. 3 TaxID=505345 RepID=A0A1A7PX67_9PAST|nr:RusA family crossover junction endodeoxyribonuclease [Gallibacterium genomosp. 3]OBX05745.1 endodeoxyribonuclease RusA [Gallibacterium genomosp. 3]
MSDWVELCLPYPPSVNHYWRHTRQGRHYISKTGKEFREKVLNICSQFDRIAGTVQMQIDVYYLDNRERDPDNLQKALFDALTASGIIDGDSNRVIKDYRVKSVGVVKGGRVIVKLRKLR